MKKLLCALFAVVLLTGCGATTPSKVTKTCSMGEGPMKLEVVAEAATEQDPVDFISMKINATLEDMGVTAADLKDTDKILAQELSKGMQEQLESMLGVDSGVKVDTATIDEKGLNVKVSLDIKAIKDQLPAENKVPTIAEFAKQIEQTGFTCK